MMRVAPDDQILRSLSTSVAESFDTDEHALRLRLLLHLPRLAGADGCVAIRCAEDEARRLAWMQPPRASYWNDQTLALPELTFAEIDEHTSGRICEQFHYLGSSRSGGTAYGLRSPSGGVVAVAVTVGCDVDILRSYASRWFGDLEPRVLARVFSVNGSPRNTLTRLFKLVARAERDRGARSLLTYVNPNLGFTGASYRAGNWTCVGQEFGTTYRYLDGNYITDRRLAELLKATVVSDAHAKRTFGPRYERSSLYLKPLQVFGRSLAGPQRRGDEVGTERRVGHQ